MRRIGRMLGAASLVAAISAWGVAGATESSADMPAAVQEYAGTLGGDVLQATVFEGDFSGDGADDAIAFIYYAGGGNAAFLDISLFESSGGKLLHKRVVENVFGDDPRGVTIAPGRVEVTMTVLKPGDPRCCPSGTEHYTIEP
jgi:hypothetical protein